MPAHTPSYPAHVRITADVPPAFAEILTPDALRFVELLSRAFTATRDALLAQRAARQARLDAGELPDFLPETQGVRVSEWTIPPAPRDLQDRRVEITGPAGDRKMVINALNSGARVFMADFEDANSPTWENSIGGQISWSHTRTARCSSPRNKSSTRSGEARVALRPSQVSSPRVKTVKRIVPFSV